MSRPGRHAARGYTLLEAMAATAIVGFAILAATAFTIRRHAILGRVDAHVVAEQALASEMDAVLADAPASLAPGVHPWRSGADDMARLSHARGTVSVTRHDGGLRLVRVELRWQGDRVVARERLVAVVRPESGAVAPVRAPP